MIKNILHTIAKNSQKKTSSLVQKKVLINEIVNAEHRSQSFNPKRARHKSMKGISVLPKK